MKRGDAIKRKQTSLERKKKGEKINEIFKPVVIFLVLNQLDT